MTADAMMATPKTDDTAASGLPDANALVLGNSYRLCQLLGDAQGTATYRGVDLAGGDEVIIKAIQLKSLPPGTLMRLEHEVSLLVRVSSDWFAPLLRSGRENNTFYLILKYIQGVALQERLQAGALKLKEALTVGKALFSALRDIHRHRVFHRGVRPSNVIVNEQGDVEKATLVDFGPARVIQSDFLIQDQPVEPALYVSPEQAGSIDHDVAEPSDLYSAGVILFHCLCGYPPFNSNNVGTILFEHMTARVPDLRSMGVAIPRGSMRFCSGFCTRTPAIGIKRRRRCWPISRPSSADWKRAKRIRRWSSDRTIAAAP